MPDSQIDTLVDQICQTEAFRRPLLVRLLKYLASNLGNERQRQEEAIRIALFDRSSHPGNADNSEVTDVRSAISHLRDELEDYFLYTNAGRTNEHRLEIPPKSKHGSYLLRAVPNVRLLESDLQFWDPYTAKDSASLIVYTKPLFFWDRKRRIYIRFLDINHEEAQISDLEEIRESIRAKLGEDHEAMTLEPCFHYQSAGESEMIRSFQTWFRQNWYRGKQLPSNDRLRDTLLEVRSSHELTEEEVFDRNIIVIGAARANKYMRVLQNDLTFRLGNESVSTNVKDEELPALDQGASVAYVLVTRRANRNPEKTVTLIGSNNGMAGARVMQYLTSKQTTKQLFQRMGLKDPQQTLPRQFQVIFAVKTAGVSMPFTARPFRFEPSPQQTP